MYNLIESIVLRFPKSNRKIMNEIIQKTILDSPYDIEHSVHSDYDFSARVYFLEIKGHIDIDQIIEIYKKGVE